MKKIKINSKIRLLVKATERGNVYALNNPIETKFKTSDTLIYFLSPLASEVYGRDLK